MPRLARSGLPDGCFHVTTRGVDGCSIFRDDDDRLALLAMLALCVRLYGWTVHAYCLMTNHYHLIVETTIAQLSAGMQLLNGEHAGAFNHKYGRKGHLFGGRFHSWIIEDEEHLAAAIAYVLANPLRAGICSTVDEYRWSAAAYDAGLVRPGAP
jgi:REP element-mobilizing transposase RayT